MESNRAVITGMGAITPLGLSVDDFWEGVTKGQSGVGPITQFDASGHTVRIAAEVKGFDPLDYLDHKEARRMARFTQFAAAATRQAIDDAGLDMAKEDPRRVGLEIGSAVGGMGIIEEQAQLLQRRGPRRVNPTFVPTVLINMAPCNIAILLGIKGPTNAPVAACTTGMIAIGGAVRRLQRGDVEVMIAGGAEWVTTPLGVAAFGRIGALSRRNDEPERACRPFDAERDGTVMGEGAAIVVLETLEHAQRRGAEILAEVVGYGLSEDAYHIAAPDPTGDGAAWAMTLALKDAGMTPGDVSYICPHGTGTPLNDVSETKAIKTAFGKDAYRIPTSSIKSMIGHMLGAAGAISVIATVKAIQENLVPPTINLETPDPECDLDYVPDGACAVQVDVAMANAFGFGGQNASLLVRRFEGA